MSVRTIRQHNGVAFTFAEGDALFNEIYFYIDQNVVSINALNQIGYTLTNEANTLKLKKNGVVQSSIDLTTYLDDTNLARLTSGTLNPTTFIATFTRDDSSTFTIDFSALADLKSVGYADLKDEFKSDVTLTPAATVSLDYTLGMNFMLTPNQNTAIDLVNPQVNTPTLILVGDGTAHGISFTYSGTSGTPEFYTVSSQGFDGELGVKYRVSINMIWSGTNEIFEISYSKLV